ncbi:hypothetical protein BaRGS_00015665, partial [Batillaria attramentaria]
RFLVGVGAKPLLSAHHTACSAKRHSGQVHNVSFAFELMQDAGLQKPKARPEDVVNLDLKSTLRVLYNIFTKYKASSSSTSGAVQ